MNAKEAREILRKSNTPGAIFECDDIKTFDLNVLVSNARGFLECHALAEGILIKALIEVKEGLCDCSDPDWPLMDHGDGCLRVVASKALADWRKANE